MLDDGRRNASGAALRLLHYWWPLALGWSLTCVVQRATGRTLDPHGVSALLAGIVAAYSLDRVLDPHPDIDSQAPSRASRLLRPLLGATGAIAAAFCMWHAWQLPLATSALMPLLGVAALAYPRLKQVPVTKTVALPLVWTWASIALPLADGSWFGWRALLEPVAAPLFCLIAAGCLLCDLKDEAADRESGVRSLPAMLGGRATVYVALALVCTAGMLALVEHRPGLAIGAAALGLATTWPALLARESTGPLVVDMILSIPGLLIAARLV